MKKQKYLKPILKWVGGKRQIIDELVKRLPKKIKRYYEPFIGGGALFFYLSPKNAAISDINQDLINLYNVIKYNIDELIEHLKTHVNTAEYFYQQRELDRDFFKFNNLSNVVKASRMLFLNKTCYNGLFRVNKAGEFNSPFGNYKNPLIVDEVALRAMHEYFNNSDIIIKNEDFSDSLKNIKKGDFVYLDPPYIPISASSSFIGYNKISFNEKEHLRLKKMCDELTQLGVLFMQSNSSAHEVFELYKNYNISIVKAKRTVNSIADKRGEIDEVIITNYDL